MGSSRSSSSILCRSPEEASGSGSRSKSTQSAAAHHSSSNESNESERYITASMVSRSRPDRLEEARDYWTIPSTTDTEARGEGSLGDICNGSATYDTIGLRFDDIPTLGGVARDATKSVGGVSEITAPRHYIPTPSISVPQEKNLTDSMIKANSTPRANLLAGLKAADHPGQYVTAAEYLALGRKQIEPRGWETNKPLTLQLYSEGASLAYRTGDTNTMNVLLDEALSRTDLTVMEKFRAYEIKILARHSADQYHEALALGLGVRKQLGLPVLIDKPRSMVSVVIEYIKTKRALGKRTAEELA
ncbi:hypothetical protein THAOC_24519, partial [Thalassiosira oceanica]